MSLADATACSPAAIDVNAMMEANRGLAVHLARTIWPSCRPWVDEDDLLQEARIGLWHAITAITKHDPARGTLGVLDRSNRFSSQDLPSARQRDQVLRQAPLVRGSDGEEDNFLAQVPDHRREADAAAGLDVAALLELLPERERLVVRLYFLEEMSVALIAQALSISDTRVSQVLQKALARLRRHAGVETDKAGGVA